jgi:alpha-L-rhamnosidase
MLTIDGLTVDYADRPLGTDNLRPAFGWRIAAARLEDGSDAERGIEQSAYRLIVAEDSEALDRVDGLIWDTGTVESGLSQHITYGGPPLQARRIYYWKVKVWNKAGEDCGWSGASLFETGYLSQEEWTADWIADPERIAPEPEPDRLRGVAVLWDPADQANQADQADQSDRAMPEESARRFFRLSVTLPEEEPLSAKLEVFAADALHIYVDGQDEGLYYPYMQSVTLDVTALLGPGRRIIAGCSDGERKGFAAVLAVIYADGRTITYGTDAGWKTTGMEEPGWMLPEFNDGAWRPASPIGVFGEGDWEVYKRILYPVNAGYGICPQFGRTFHVAKQVKQARLYASALGVYRAALNDRPVSTDALAPGWTDYRIRIPYQTYDVTSLLQAGDNRIEAIVGPGWYAGHLGICGPYHYGHSVAFRAELHVLFADGTTEIVRTDPNWRVTDSPVVSSDFYMGETCDARNGLLESPWRKAVRSDHVPSGRMAASEGPPIRPMLEIKPQSVRRADESTFLIDMGQNITGWIRLRLKGTEGARIRIRYAERLGTDGRLYRANLRTAKQTDVYIARGDREESYEPLFTYHGFQYVEIEGYPGELELSAITGIVVHSELRDVGELTTSHPLVNRLMDNIRWSQRGNFIGIPLDCPQRDERLGWMGDAHMFARTATFNMNSAAFYRKWLTDIRDAQGADGAFPDVAPFVEHFGRGHVFFADGGVILPWTMYKVYGDRRFIEDNYEAMQRYMDYLVQDSDERLVRRTESFGDHLAYGAETPRPLMNLFLFAYSVSLMADMARVVGDETGEARYRALFARLRMTFETLHVDEDGRIEGESQTAYVLALKIGLLTNEGRQAAMRHLLRDIEERGWHLTTGFMGASYVLPVLSDNGEHDAASRLLLQESFPSWLYPVLQGATTIWERWDGWTEEKGFQDPEMNSFNHFALGSVGEWLYRYLAGIQIPEGEYGSQRFIISPLPAPGFEWLRCKHDTLYGMIGVEWEADEHGFTLAATIPANTTAEIAVPASPGMTIQVDGEHVGEDALKRDGDGWSFVSRNEQTARFTAGSGRYVFRVSGQAVTT